MNVRTSMLAPPSPDQPTPPGALFEGTPYRALERLGGGGMGEVFLVEHRELRRRCAAKVLRAEVAKEPRVAERFRVEAQALGRLRHAHIVSVLGLGTTQDGRPFIAMEYLRGRTLGQELSAREGHQLPVLEALSYATQISSALGAVHALGLVHRDIKPDNIVLCSEPGGERIVKVLDFGVVRVLPDAPTNAPPPLSAPTATGEIVGTPRYVSPEVVQGQRADPRSDLYAAALVLYRMLAGRGPFDHVQNDELVLQAHAETVPEPPSRWAGVPIPPEVDRLLLRALAKNPAERFQTAEELGGALEQVLDLLRSPQGWAETATFDLDELRSAAQEGALAGASARPPKQDVPNDVRAVASAEVVALDVTTGGAVRPSRLTLLLVFGGALLGTVALLAGLVAVVRALS